MDLENLEQYTDEQRKEVANHYYLDGQHIFQQAQKDNFNNIELLQNACSAFIQALKINSEDPRVYLSLANIYLTIEDFPTAYHYIEGALELNQYNVLALDLKKRIDDKIYTQNNLNPLKMVQLSQIIPITPDDYYKMYDQTEDWLHVKVKECMEANLNLAINPSELNRLKSQFALFQSDYQHLSQSLILIDEELDVSELYQLSRPIEVYIERLQTLITNSQKYLDLNTEILEEAHLLRTNIIKAKRVKDISGLPELEEQLEIIQDKHELYRNQLDELRRLKLPIQSLLTRWKMLNQILEHFQEILEDTFMKLM